MPLQKRPNMHYLYEIDGSSLPWKPSHNIRSLIIKSVIFDCHTQIQDFLSIFTSFYPKNMVCGREFRSSLRRPMPNAAKTRPVCRIVPAFTIQANQKNTCVAPPPRQYVIMSNVEFTPQLHRKRMIFGHSETKRIFHTKSVLCYFFVSLV